MKNNVISIKIGTTRPCQIMAILFLSVFTLPAFTQSWLHWFRYCKRYSWQCMFGHRRAWGDGGCGCDTAMNHKQVETHSLQKTECHLMRQYPTTTQVHIPHRRNRPVSVTLIQRHRRRRQIRARTDVQQGDHRPSGCRNWRDNVAASQQRHPSCPCCR